MGTIVLSSFKDDDGILFKLLLDEVLLQPLDLVEKAHCRASNWLGGKRYSAERAGYVNHLSGYILTNEGKSRYISLFYGPMKLRYNLPVYKLVWHQSQWSSQKEVVETFSRYLGLEKSYEIFFSWKIERLDLWIDTGFSFDVLKRSIFKSKISSREIIKSNLKTYYWGSPASKARLMAYEKLVDPSCIDVGPAAPVRNGTRIELRLMSDKVPILNYSEYKRLSGLNLFESVRNYFLSKSAWQKVSDDMTGLRLIKLQKFHKLVIKEGFSCAMKEMNKDHNFERTLGKHISKHAKVHNFSEIWKNKVSACIIRNFEIDTYFEKGSKNSEDCEFHKMRFYYDHHSTTH